MPRLVNNIEVMTSQEWMRLGYPVFVASALEHYNADCAEDGGDLVTPASFAAMSTVDQLALALEWEGIIGYNSQIHEAVEKLVDLSYARRGLQRIAISIGAQTPETPAEK